MTCAPRPVAGRSDSFCEACGTALARRRCASDRRGRRAAGPLPVLRGRGIGARRPYCDSCGPQAPSGRDHSRARPGPGGRGHRPRPAAPPERGRHGARDRRATRSGPAGGRVVCDGVSTSRPAGRGVAGRRAGGRRRAAGRVRMRRGPARRRAAADRQPAVAFAEAHAVSALAAPTGGPRPVRPAATARRSRRAGRATADVAGWATAAPTGSAEPRRRSG